jgi:drug/metabolite transporter (DMT)-like permease
LLPPWLASSAIARIADIPWQALALQIGIQGIAAGILAVLAFTRSVELLGPGRAAIFPALVPAFAMLIGLPLTGDAVSAWQWLGLSLTTFGLLYAIGILRSAAHA